MRCRIWFSCFTLTILIAASACKKSEAPSTSTEPGPVATVTAVDTTPTGGTVVTGTVAIVPVDQAFVVAAGVAMLAEIDFAKTADSGAKDVVVKAFGHLLFEDMMRLHDELAQYTPKHGVTLPTVTDTGNQNLNQRLATLTGKNFDETFLKQVISDHTAMIKLFEDESKVVTDEDLRKWVNDTLPVLRGHLQKAEELEKKISKQKY